MAQLTRAGTRVAGRETPARLIAFDLLAIDAAVLLGHPLRERRARLESLIENALGALVTAAVGSSRASVAPRGGPSRWSATRDTAWEPLRPTLVVEVSFDQVSGHRFRHGTRLLRWRPDKAPRQCTFEQLRGPPRAPAASRSGAT